MPQRQPIEHKFRSPTDQKHQRLITKVYAAQDSRADETGSTRLSSSLLMATPTESGGSKYRSDLTQADSTLPSIRNNSNTNFNPQSPSLSSTNFTESCEIHTVNLGRFHGCPGANRVGASGHAALRGKLSDPTYGTMQSRCHFSCYRPVLCPEGRLAFAVFKS